MRVAVGRWICSRAASSLGVSGPWRSIETSAALCDGDRPGAGLLAQAPRGARDGEAEALGERGRGDGDAAAQS